MFTTFQVRQGKQRQGELEDALAAAESELDRLRKRAAVATQLEAENASVSDVSLWVCSLFLKHALFLLHSLCLCLCLSFCLFVCHSLTLSLSLPLCVCVCPDRFLSPRTNLVLTITIQHK